MSKPPTGGESFGPRRAPKRHDYETELCLRDMEAERRSREHTLRLMREERGPRGEWDGADEGKRVARAWRCLGLHEQTEEEDLRSLLYRDRC